MLERKEVSNEQLARKRGQEKRSSPATAKVTAGKFSGGKAKVGEDNLATIVLAEDILGLEVAMENALAVAVLDGVEDLEKNALDHLVVADVPLPFRDHPKEVPFLTELEDDVDGRLLLDVILERHDVVVGGREGGGRRQPAKIQLAVRGGAGSGLIPPGRRKV